jgi:hypothetical protein
MKIISAATSLTAVLLSEIAQAHVPFLEERDFSSAQPYVVHEVTNSKSIHAQIGAPGDVDIYRISISKPVRIFASTTIPFCSQYRDFSVTFALTGPGLPRPDVELPVKLAPGLGAIVVRDPAAGQRPTWVEPFSGRKMWTGPDYALDDAPPGTYELIVWNEQGRTGDYIAVIGEAEIFNAPEIRQVAMTSPKLEHGTNLMVPCDPTVARPARPPVMTNRPAIKADDSAR